MTDSELIQKYGGPAAVARLMRYDEKRGGVQRVQNWITRGIPAKVKIQRPDLFLPDFSSNEVNVPAPASQGDAN